jgi:hypothetical protein
MTEFTIFDVIIRGYAGLWFGWNLSAQTVPRNTFQPANLLTLVGVLGAGVYLGLIAGADAFGVYGVGLFFGFFTHVLVSLALVAISKNRDFDWFLDGRQLRPMRVMTAEFTPAESRDVPAAPALRTVAGRTYDFSLELGPPVARADEVPSVSSTSPNSRARLKVALFTFAGEFDVEHGADLGEFDLEPNGSTRVDSNALSRADPHHSASAGPSQKLAFRVHAPRRGGTYRIRCNVYFDEVLIQSRVITVRLPAFPPFVERLLRLLVNPIRSRFQPRPRVARSQIDFSLSRALDPRQMEQFAPHRLSLMLNDNGDGTHSLRFAGAQEFKGDATFDGHELQYHIERVRSALRMAAWGTEEPWERRQAYRYADSNSVDTDRLKGDLVNFALRGYRFFDAIIDRFAGGAPQARELTKLMREPGRVQVALKRSARLVLPAAMIYDYPLDTNAEDGWRLCDSFLQHLSSRDTPLEETECFRGVCPNLGDLAVVCPSGFWGFRHALGMPLSGPPGMTVPSELACPLGPQLAVAVSTDPAFILRSTHETTLKQLQSSLRWEYGATRKDVLRLLKETQAQIVYFYCHGGLANRVPYIQVGPPDERGITRDNLRAEEVWWGNLRPLVFINGCHTAALEPETGIEFISGFVETAGAAGVIGTEITVFEPLASTFAEDCLRRFVVYGAEIGEAVRGARLALLKAGNPLGLVYIPYVVASLRLAASLRPSMLSSASSGGTGGVACATSPGPSVSSSARNVV